MKGYWRGTYSGTNSGQMIVEMDDRGDHFNGCAYAFDSNRALPSTFAVIRTIDKQPNTKLKCPLLPIDPRSGEPVDWQQLATLYAGQNVIVPKEAELEYAWTDQQLVIRWTTDIGTSGEATLAKSKARAPSERTPLPIATWQEFKAYIVQLEPYRYIFRGQTRPWRLQTPFHRTGRGDLRRFFSEDISTLHRHLSALTKHVFDLSNPLQNAAFLNLVQHHGYPTPLLDWTYSPFVAAYFAFYRAKDDQVTKSIDANAVRIFIFDKAEWCSNIQQILSTSIRWPHFTILEPIAIGNERLIPQQALSSYTTVDDMETYISRWRWRERNIST